MRGFMLINPSDIKTDEKSYTNIFFTIYIGYVVIKESKYVKVSNINPLYFISSNWMHTLKKLMKMNINTSLPTN